MVVQVVPDYKTMSCRAAEVISREIRRKPNLVLGLAAGNTPSGTYEELVRMHREEKLDFSRVVFFSLDEFHGLSDSDPRSFSVLLKRSLLDQINANQANVHLVTSPSSANL